MNVDWGELEHDAYYDEEAYGGEPRAVDGVEVLNTMPWFVERATRHSAEALLQAAGKSSFLVRPSSQPLKYALSMIDDTGRIIHAAIQQNAAMQYYIEGAPDPYPTITKLVGSLQLFPVARSIVQRYLPEEFAQVDDQVRSGYSLSPRSLPAANNHQYAPAARALPKIENSGARDLPDVPGSLSLSQETDVNKSGYTLKSPRGAAPKKPPLKHSGNAALKKSGNTTPRAARSGTLNSAMQKKASGAASTHHSGILSKKGQKRLFLLQDHSLSWFLPDALSHRDAPPKGQLDVRQCSVVAGKDERCFVVQALDGTAQFELKAASGNEAHAWMHVINKVKLTRESSAPAADGSEPPHRKGLLTIRGGKERYFVLLRSHLMWMASSTQPELLGTLPMAGAAVASSSDAEAAFSVTPVGNAPLELVASSGAEAHKWCAALRDAVNHVSVDNRPSGGAERGYYQEQSGWLKKKFKRRFCSLRDDVFLWADDDNTPAKGHLTLDGAGVYFADELTGAVMRPVGKPTGKSRFAGALKGALGGERSARVGTVTHSFVVNTAFGRSYTFEARDRAECAMWVASLQQNARLASAAAAASLAAASMTGGSGIGGGGGGGGGGDSGAASASTSATTSMAGWMKKKSKRRWFVLRDNVLYWFESDTHASGSMRNVKNSADMRGASVRGSAPCELTLYLAQGSQYVLQAGDARTRDDWIRAIESSIRAAKATLDQVVRDTQRIGGGGGAQTAAAATKAGWTVKKGRRRWLAMRGGSLLWYDENPNAAKSAAKLKGSLPLAGCTHGAVDGHSDAFYVETSLGHRYEFAAQSAADCKEWLGALKLVIAGKSREHEVALAAAQRHAGTLNALFGLAGGEPAGGTPRSAAAASTVDPNFDLLHLLLTSDDSAENVQASLMLACAQQRHLDLLGDCVTRELDKSIAVNTLFRTNSITTKLVREFLLLSTANFLRRALEQPVRAIVADPSGFECDPAKLPANTRIGERLKRVAVAADGILSAVIANLCYLPRDVRRFFQRTHVAVDRYFPGHYRTVAAGFLFLRFICPAIFSPVMFHLVTEPLEPTEQRALILVAKVLQNLANGVEFGKKEAFLGPLNKWLRAKLPTVEALYEDLALVDNVDYSLAPFDSREQAGLNAHIHTSVLYRRTAARLQKLKKAAEDAESMNALGALLRFEKLK